MSDVRGVWVDEGNDADEAKIRAVQANPWYSTRDPWVTAKYLTDVASRGFFPGLYVASSWVPQLTGEQFAQYVSDSLLRIGWRGNPWVCMDIETHDIAGFVLPCFRRWRELRPARPTWWSLEGMQGGLFDSPTVAEIAGGLGIRVAPQLYSGDMTPLAHSPILDLLMAGFPGAYLDGTYDAARLPYRWRGFAFTQGRLP